MMKIQVLGSGCPTCAKLNEIVVQIVKDLGSDTKVEYLIGPVGINRILELGVMSSPVLVIDDKVAMVGFTGDIDYVRSIISKRIKGA